MNKDNIKKTIQFVIIAAVVLVFTLFVVIIVQAIMKANLNKKIEMLEAEIERVTGEIVDIEDEIEYRKSSEYIEKYIREKLGMIKDGETKYVPK